jgi:hypothetical protein
MIRGIKELPLFLNGARAAIEQRDGHRFIRCKVTPDGNISLS